MPKTFKQEDAPSNKSFFIREFTEESELNWFWRISSKWWFFPLMFFLMMILEYLDMLRYGGFLQGLIYLPYRLLQFFQYFTVPFPNLILNGPYYSKILAFFLIIVVNSFFISSVIAIGYYKKIKNQILKWLIILWLAYILYLFLENSYYSYGFIYRLTHFYLY